jgi:hypothetical protein
MKTKFFSVLFIAVTSLSIFTISCKKEDTANTNTNASILGKWNVMNQTYTSFDSLQNVTDGDTLNYTAGEMVLDFKENGMVIDTDSDGETDTSYYTLNGVMLKVSDVADMSETMEFTIQNLTSSELNFYSTFTDGDGSSEKMTFTAKR